MRFHLKMYSVSTDVAGSKCSVLSDISSVTLKSSQRIILSISDTFFRSGMIEYTQKEKQRKK